MFKNNPMFATLTLRVYLPKQFSSYVLRLVALFAVLPSISGTVLDVASNSSVTVGPYPKDNDVIGCAPEYGENLDRHACSKTLQNMPDGRRFIQFVSRKSYHGQTALITPIYYYDNQSEYLDYAASC